MTTSELNVCLALMWESIHAIPPPPPTTTPSAIPLTRGLGRSESRQPYPCKY